MLQTDDVKICEIMKAFTEICPICGKEFSCNKAYHVYTARIRRKRQYYCSYSCYKKLWDGKSNKGDFGNE